METTLYKIKEDLAALGAQIAQDANWIAQKAGDPKVKMDEIQEKKAHRDELQARFDMLKEQHDAMEQEAKKSLEQKVRTEKSPEARMVEKKGDFYYAAITGRDLKKAYEGLGAIPAGDPDLGNGDALLPKNLATELLTEPFETNSLRQVEPVSNITGLEEPKLDFVIEDADLADVTDKETAKEIEVSGDTIAYGRYKTKVSVTIKDTVLHGTRTNLVSTVENGLRSALAIKEKMRAFDQSPDDEHAHMSFYSSKNAIKTVKGATMLEAIINAYGDLADFYAQNAVCVMRRSDYTAMIASLVNGSESLFGRKPEEVIGVPVVFNDRAVIPIVGDFRYAKQNYDIGTIYETDKDGKKGEYYFIVTAWGDHRIRLKSAFRLAVIGSVPTLESVTISGTAKVGQPLSVTATYSSGNPTPNLAYQWKRADTSGGSYTDIDGAVYGTYTPVAEDQGKFLKVNVTATGSATGTKLSTATAAVAAAE